MIVEDVQLNFTYISRIEDNMVDNFMKLLDKNNIPIDFDKYAKFMNDFSEDLFCIEHSTHAYVWDTIRSWILEGMIGKDDTNCIRVWNV